MGSYNNQQECCKDSYIDLIRDSVMGALDIGSRFQRKVMGMI
jgi:hypothetical protein